MPGPALAACYLCPGGRSPAAYTEVKVSPAAYTEVKVQSPEPTS